MDKNEARFIDAKDIMELTGLSKAAAYRLIQQLNEELARKGYMTVRGRVIYPYFYERFFGKDGDADASIINQEEPGMSLPVTKTGRASLEPQPEEDSNPRLKLSDMKLNLTKRRTTVCQ